MKPRSLESIEATNTLKGIAISVVLINHYMNLNISGDNRGYANLWISIFFILSGYGLFQSLSYRFGGNSYNAKALFSFYFQRFIRIFPLLWIAWFFELIIRRGDLSFWIPAGIHGSGHYWFIPALLQCYIISPVIYRAIKKSPIISLVILIAAFVSINFLFLSSHVPSVITKLADFTRSKWRGLYFLNIVIFAFGLFIPVLLRTLRTRGLERYAIGSKIIFWLVVFSSSWFS